MLATALAEPKATTTDCSDGTIGGESDGTCRSATTTTTTSTLTDPYLKELLTRIHVHEFFINGSWVQPMNEETIQQTLDVVDPSTGEAFANISVGDWNDTDWAVRSAHAAYTNWSLYTSAHQRKVYVQRIMEIYHSRQEELAYLISREMGSPIDMARESQVSSGYSQLRSNLLLFNTENFPFVRTLPNIKDEEEVENAATTIIMDPIGVVAAITPWNWPLNQITVKVIPALLVGCTVVLKPSEITPLSALVFADIVREAGLPPGVFNLVTGVGTVVGQQLSSHPLVDMVSFTGSKRAGALVSKAAADTFKKVLLELGGKGALIVFDDVGDWAEEVLEGATNDFYNSGQSCNVVSRLLVHRSLYKEAIALTKASAEETRVDSAHLEGEDHIGPVSSQRQYERIQEYIQSGIDQGATLVAGGLGKPDHLKDSLGAYVRPTVFADCTADMTIFQEEIFGPVLCITPFDTEEEAIELANGTPYGLSNYAYTRSGPRRRRLAARLKSGQVELNGEPGDLGAPFGGVRASGNGREGGIYGLEEFCVIKAVTGYHDDRASDYELQEDQDMQASDVLNGGNADEVEQRAAEGDYYDEYDYDDDED